MNEEPDEELWLMIKTSGFFRTDLEVTIEDDLIAIIERNNLGEIDGHSSGSHQFELNFFGVSDYDGAKELVVGYMKLNHPKLEYLVSQEYETPFEIR